MGEKSHFHSYPKHSTSLLCPGYLVRFYNLRVRQYVPNPFAVLQVPTIRPYTTAVHGRHPSVR